MTIFFNQRWNGYPQSSIATLDIHNERDLIAKGIATEVEISHIEATTTAGGQAITSRNGSASRMYIKAITFDDAESLKIGFGDSYATAKTAASTGVVLKGKEEITLDIPAGSSYFGFVSVGGAVDFYYVFD